MDKKTGKDVWKVEEPGGKSGQKVISEWIGSWSTPLIVTVQGQDQLIMTWDGIKFDEQGQNTHVKAIIIQLQGGKFYTVWPWDSATRDVIYPIPAWKDRK